MKSPNFLEYIDKLAEEYQLTREQTIEAFEKSLISGCKKSCQVKSCKLIFNEKYEEYFLFKEYFVLEPQNEQNEFDAIETKKITCINLEKAKKLKKNAQIGDIIHVEIDPKEFSFYASKDFKNKFNEELIKFKRENIFHFFKNYEKKIINGKVISIKEKFYTLELEKELQAILLKKKALPEDNFSINERVQVYVIEVQKTTKLPKLLLSRTHTHFVLEIFKEFIPEIQEGIVEIIEIARIPSIRVKIGLLSHNKDIEPIGSCIGKKNTRIQNIIKILKSEKIDLFLWSDNPEELIKNALQPAKIKKIEIINEKKKIASVFVEKEQISLAIGKLGSNVQLASQVTKWNISIKNI
ncbi:MAG: transcription termination factor NusA [Candidatus Phytoplasma stylosanthis]|uniref:transcription termination factor NusA n=1 Tax=Candidatus Phytoplasma stylosanthis TaxID=2798314 RepID=UPI00293A435E|nr:transcription termination factor NusA [Candidatus Phytoplasma stylosanthis]MDV3168138.1 transcription termination factor NusA [Candidatus Phytoplasma stylosanthis]MDV3170827.1 transcription termination factor NusA [Candidatus Phytoplasma stylosanthis]MDV3173751.1 transcription termination factor NusA [Candidatus Phytoplasma stylosanthis]MDV3174159.1 transcription termination factor NusA [Candidatus Phytoplasma stylosanthis]MDV3202549.1 transcription termination factor NusA [Candidatus Phyto